MTGVRETEINHGEARRLPDRPTIAMAAEDAIESLYTIVIGQHVEQCIAGTSNEALLYHTSLAPLPSLDVVQLHLAERWRDPLRSAKHRCCR